MRRPVHDHIAEEARDAAQEVVDFYQRYFMTLEVGGKQRPDAMVRKYDSVRSLRDKLSDVIRQRKPMIELDREGANLLVSCCVFCMDEIVVPLKECVRGTGKHASLQKRMSVLFTLACEFANNPVAIIDRPDRIIDVSSDQRRIVDAINTKVITGERKVPRLVERLVALGPGDKPPGAGEVSTDWEDVAPTRLDEGSVDFWAEDDGASRRNPLPSHPSAINNRMKTPGFETGSCVEFGDGAGGRGEDNFIPGDDAFGKEPADPTPDPFDPLGESSFAEDDPFNDEFFTRPIEPSEQSEPSPADKPEPRRRSASRPAAVTPQQRVEQPDYFTITSSFIRDNQLRSMVELDQQGLNRALANGDTRLAAVFLCSLFEAVVLDLSLQRDEDLSRRGLPDTWDLRLIVFEFLEEVDLVRDKSILAHVLMCRNLVHPSAQLSNLVIVNWQALVKMIDSVQRFVARFGLSHANA